MVYDFQININRESLSQAGLPIEQCCLNKKTIDKKSIKCSMFAHRSKK